MKHYYYAFCETHKKCGERRETQEEAYQDCEAHHENVSGYHGRIYVMLSNIILKDGVKKYYYKGLTDTTIHKDL